MPTSMRQIARSGKLRPCPHPGAFHLTSDGLAVVKPHPQATSCFAREQGYIVLRIEPAYREMGAALVAAMNVARLLP